MEERKLASKGGIVLDILLTGIFFIFMVSVLKEHVPAETSKMQLIFSVFTALPLAGVFWLALGLFRVTVADMKLRRKEGKDI